MRAGKWMHGGGQKPSFNRKKSARWRDRRLVKQMESEREKKLKPGRLSALECGLKHV